MREWNKGDGMGEAFNLCDGCAKWPCGYHSPIGISGSVTTECANRQPTSGSVIVELKAEIDAIKSAARLVVDNYEYDTAECAKRPEGMCDMCKAIHNLRAALLNRKSEPEVKP